MSVLTAVPVVSAATVVPPAAPVAHVLRCSCVSVAASAGRSVNYARVVQQAQLAAQLSPAAAPAEPSRAAIIQESKRAQQIQRQEGKKKQLEAKIEKANKKNFVREVFKTRRKRIVKKRRIKN